MENCSARLIIKLHVTDFCSVMSHESTFGLKFDSANVLPLLNWRKNCLTSVTMSCLLQSPMSIWLKIIIILNKMDLSRTNCNCFSFTGLKKETRIKFCHSPQGALRSDRRHLLHFHFAQHACGCVACRARRDGRLTQLVCECVSSSGMWEGTRKVHFSFWPRSLVFFSTLFWLFCLEAKFN